MSVSEQNTKRSTLHDVNGTFSIVVELLTIFVNVLPVYVILKSKRFRNRSTSDDIIIALSVTFIMSMLIPSPIAHVSYFNKGWYGGRLTCTFYQVMVNWLRLLTLCLMSLLCVAKSFSVHLFIHQKPMNCPKVKVKFIATMFILIVTSLLISVFPVLGLGPFTPDHPTCIPWIVTIPQHRLEYVFIISYISCGFFNLVCIFVSKVYMGFRRKSILLKLYEHRGNNQQEDVRWQMEGTIALHGIRMTIGISILICITWLPALVLILLKILGLSVSDRSVLYALLSTSLSGLLNPIIYGLSDITYRRGYKRLFQGIKGACRCKTGGHHSIQAVTSGDGVQRPETEHLSENQLRHSRSASSQTSGFVNSAFTEVNDEAMSLPRYIETDRNAAEDTRLLPRRNEFDAFSHFGGPEDTTILTSSSSSMLSSDEDSYEDLGSNDESDDDENELEYNERSRESIM